MSKSPNTRRGNEKKQVVDRPRESCDSMFPIWSFQKIDRDGPFRFSENADGFDSEKIIRKLIDYSFLTWSQIKEQTHDRGKNKNHFLDPKGFSKEAKERIKAKGLETESDQLFSLAIENRARIIGIVHKNVFHIVWYDPYHKLYPITK